MKKIVLATLGIVLTATSATALIDHYKTIPAGEYRCPEQDDTTCKINIYKTGDIVFGTDCVEDQYSTASKYAPMIKRNQCQVLPDPGKYYLCEFADAKCNVNVFASRTAISCINNKNSTNYTADRSYVNHKILQAVQTGQCKERYLAESTTTEETTTTKKPVVQKPQEQPVKPEVKPVETPQPTVPEFQPAYEIFPEIQVQEPADKILEIMQQQYKDGIRQQLEKEVPTYMELYATPDEQTPTTQLPQDIDNIDANIKMILEKYENLEWEQTE